MSHGHPQLGGRCAYEILGVPADASEQQIRAAHHRLARKHHPDLNPDDTEAATAFTTLLNAARDVLLHDRAAYDAQRFPSEPAPPDPDRWTPPRTPHPPPPSRAPSSQRTGTRVPPRFTPPPQPSPPDEVPWQGHPTRRPRRPAWRESVPPLRRSRRLPRARWEAPAFGLLSLAVMAAMTVAVLHLSLPGRDDPPAQIAALPVARAEVPLPYQGRWKGQGPGETDLEVVIVAGRDSSRAVYGRCGAALTPIARTDTSITFAEQPAKDCKAAHLRVVARHEGELEISFCADEPCRSVTWKGVLREVR